MTNCTKCGTPLKEPYKFCSNCGSRQNEELIKDQDDVNNTKMDEDGFNDEDVQKHDNNSIEDELIIGEICSKIYLN